MRKTEKLADNWTEETVEYVSGIVSAAHRFQSAYLQTPPEHASNRRSLEKYYIGGRGRIHLVSCMPGK